MSLGVHTGRGSSRPRGWRCRSVSLGLERSTALTASIALQLLTLLAPGSPAGAVELRKGAPIEITADRIIYEAPREVYVAEGSVRVVQLDRSIEADWAVFNRNTLRGIAAGDVVMVDGEQTLEARFVEFDYDRQQGLIFGGRLDMGEGEFLVGADELLKTGEDTYTGHDVSFTTCRCPDPEDRLPWQVNAKDADVEIGGYATATNASLDILGVPTVWLPWTFFPVKTERESGILFPQFGYGSRNGFEVALPLFWAARDNINVIATPRYLTKRGFKPELEIEAVYGERSETDLYGTYLRDQNADESVRGGRKQSVYDRDRWAVGFDNDVQAPGGVRVRSDIQIVSDNEFVRDFDDFRKFRKDRFLESTAFGFRHFGSDGSGAVVGGVTYADDRQSPDFDDRDKFLLQRAPSVSLDWLPSPVFGHGGPTFELGVDYTHFRPYERAEDALDLTSGDIVGDDLWADIGIAAIPGNTLCQVDFPTLCGFMNGRFDEGEPLNDQGHRVILYPHVAHPMRLFDSIDVLPEVGWQQSLYSTRAQSFEDRGLLMARLDVSSQLVGTLAPLGLPETRHVLEPRFGWALVQHQSQTNNPLFIPETAIPETRLRQMSLDNVVLDDADRIRSANVVTLGLGNRFYRTQGSRQRLLADISLSGAYNFAARAGHFQQLILEGTTFGASGLVSRGILGYDLDRGRVSEGLAEITVPLTGRLPGVRTASIGLSYRYRREIPLFFEAFQGVKQFNDFERGLERVNQVRARARVGLSQRWAFGTQQLYSFENQLHQTNRWFVEYVSPCRCWGIHVDLDDNRNRGFQANAVFSVMGFGDSDERPFAGKSRFGSGLAD